MAPAHLLRALPLSTKIAVASLVSVTLALLVVKVYNDDLSTPVPYIQLLPRYAVFYPWVFVTAVFAEVSILGFLVSLALLVVATKYVEKFWGYKEVLKFICLVGSLTNLITVIVVIIINVLRNNVHGMNQPLGGGVLYYIGFLVVLKQVIPEQNVLLFQGLVTFRLKHLPFILLVLGFAWSIFFKSFYPVLPAFIAFIVSYNYLRFFQSFYAESLLPTNSSATAATRNSGIIRGDASDAFLLMEFFPSAFAPALCPIINGIYDVSVLLSIVTPYDDDAIELSNLRVRNMSQQAANMAKRGNSEADRRRQVALQVIEERENQQ